jgi:hypothetical protein
MVVYSFRIKENRVDTGFCCCRLVVTVSVSILNAKLPAKWIAWSLDHTCLWCQVATDPCHATMCHTASQHVRMQSTIYWKKKRNRKARPINNVEKLFGI